MKYKGYRAKLDWDSSVNKYFGKLLNLKEEVEFEAQTMSEAKRAFRAAVEEYLKYCKDNGIEPEKPEDTFYPPTQDEITE
jgi:predicted HicB family RNase H-like nuclease